jgi:putative restriction endonuclease
MLDSNQIERELELRGFTLCIDNTHARGFLSSDNEHLLYVKSSRKLRVDPLTPVYKQPLVLHWSIKNSLQYSGLAEIVASINPNYKNHNMRGFEGPRNNDKPNGIAIDVDSGHMIEKVLLLIGVSTYLNKLPYEDLTAAQASLDNLPETTRKAIIDARLGQGKFREELISLWEGCAVTGCSLLKLLRASHIKPWRDSDNTDRLNKFNGLLLTANLDQAFDQGMISFDAAGHILIKTHLFNDDDFAALNIRPDMKLRHLHDEHQPFLAKHRRMHKFDK